MGGHFFCLSIADGECSGDTAPIFGLSSSFFAAKYVRFCLEKLIHFMDRPYETINGTVRPAFVFRGKIVVWNLMLMSILMENS